MLGKIGKESIKRRIALFDIDTLELDIALGARKMLGNLLIDNVKQASAGAATFYVWVCTQVTWHKSSDNCSLFRMFCLMHFYDWFWTEKTEMKIILHKSEKLNGYWNIENVFHHIWIYFKNYDVFVKVQGIVDEMQSRYSDMIGLVAPRTHLMSGQGKTLQMVLDVNEYMALHDIWLPKKRLNLNMLFGF